MTISCLDKNSLKNIIGGDGIEPQPTELPATCGCQTDNGCNFETIPEGGNRCIGTQTIYTCPPPSLHPC